MNPIKFFYRMLKSDISTIVTTIKRLKNNEPVFDPQKLAEFKSEIKRTTIKSYFEENWLWIMTIAFAAIMTWVMAANYYSIQANNFIIENCGPELLSGGYNGVLNITDFVFNMTK